MFTLLCVNFVKQIKESRRTWRFKFYRLAKSFTYYCRTLSWSTERKYVSHCKGCYILVAS